MLHKEMYLSWQIDMSQIAKSVWKSLTSRAHLETYEAWASYELLETESSISKKSVQRAVFELEGLGLLKAFRGNGRSSYTVFKLDIHKINALIPSRPCHLPFPAQEDEKQDSQTPLEDFIEKQDSPSVKGDSQSVKGDSQTSNNNSKNKKNTARASTRIRTPHTAPVGAEVSDQRQGAEGETVNRPSGAGLESGGLIPIVQGLQCSNEHWQDFQLCLQKEDVSDWMLHEATFSGFDGSEPLIIFSSKHRNNYFRNHGSRQRFIAAYEAILRERVGEINLNPVKEAAE